MKKPSAAVTVVSDVKAAGDPLRADQGLAGQIQSLKDILDRPTYDRLKSEGRLGAGGMAEVDLAIDGSLMRQVARKTLRGKLLDEGDVVRLFIREMRITARLDHPFIVPIYEMGFDGEGRLFFTMKRFAGRSLEQVLAGLPATRIDRHALFTILEALVKVCDALAFAHDRGIVHCDLKPEHIVMDDFGQLYLIDWGIAHIMPGGAEDLRALSDDSIPLIAGSCRYMSPEQAEGDRSRLSPATDVFALGAILYAMFARRAPYHAGDFSTNLENARMGRCLPLSELTEPGTVPPDLEQLITRAMAANPADRFPDVQSLGEELRAFMRGQGEFPTIRYAAGEQIVKQGEVGDCAFIVRSGGCEAYRMDGDIRVPLEVMRAGHVFGELALLTDQTRSASVVALDEGVEVHQIRAQDFRAEIDDLKPWIRDLVVALATRIRRAEDLN